VKEQERVTIWPVREVLAVELIGTAQLEKLLPGVGLLEVERKAVGVLVHDLNETSHAERLYHVPIEQKSDRLRAAVADVGRNGTVVVTQRKSLCQVHG